MLLRAQYKLTKLAQPTPNRAAALSSTRTGRQLAPSAALTAGPGPHGALPPHPGGPENRVPRYSLPSGVGRAELGHSPSKAAPGAATQKCEDGLRGFLLPEFTANGAAILARGGAGHRRRTRRRPTGRGAAFGGASGEWGSAAPLRSPPCRTGRGPAAAPTPLLVRISERRFTPLHTGSGSPRPPCGGA